MTVATCQVTKQTFVTITERKGVLKIISLQK